MRRSIFAVILLWPAHAGAQPLTPEATEQLRAIEQERAARSPVERKMSSQLLYATREAQGRPPVAAVPGLRPFATAPQGREMVTVKGRITPELEAFITALGGTELASLPRFGQLSVRLPLRQVEALAARPEIRSLDITARAVTNQAAGLSDADGDAAHDGAMARRMFRTDGTGVKVCVMSDSVDGLAQSQARGALGPVEVLAGSAGSASGEGTAMLEIVHRIAPGATLAFATSNPSPVTMALNIARFAVAKCDIIVDDITYGDEPPFQDGVIAQVAREVSDSGILFFSSAANSGNKRLNESGTWEGDFRPGGTLNVAGKVYVFHEFEPGVSQNVVTSFSEKVPVAVLTWSDPQGAASNEYQLAVIGPDGQVLDHSTTAIEGEQDPVQTVAITPGARLAILKAPDAAPRFLRLITNRGRLRSAPAGRPRRSVPTGRAGCSSPSTARRSRRATCCRRAAWC